MSRKVRRALKQANGDKVRAKAILRAQAGPTASPDAIAADMRAVDDA